MLAYLYLVIISLRGVTLLGYRNRADVGRRAAVLDSPLDVPDEDALAYEEKSSGLSLPQTLTRNFDTKKCYDP